MREIVVSCCLVHRMKNVMAPNKTATTVMAMSSVRRLKRFDQFIHGTAPSEVARRMSDQ